MLILATLFIIFLLVIFDLVLGNSLMSSVVLSEIDNEAIVEGEPFTFQVEGQDILFGISSLEGMIILLVAIITIATIVGIQVLGSGLSDNSVRTITIVSFYYGLWIMLSTLIFSLINSIEIFGYLIYIALTIVYTIGVFQKVQGGE